MGQLILYTGGARCGKSQLAQERAASFQEVIFIATAEARDEEMARRIARHKSARPAAWTTLEEPLALSSAIELALSKKPAAILIDCLTLWLSNCMLRDWKGGWTAAKEDAVLQSLQEAMGLLRKAPSLREALLVSNEVGSSVVPENEMARSFQSLSGRGNQLVASSCHEVYLVTAGLPLRLK